MGSGSAGRWAWGAVEGGGVGDEVRGFELYDCVPPASEAHRFVFEVELAANLRKSGHKRTKLGDRGLRAPHALLEPAEGACEELCLTFARAGQQGAERRDELAGGAHQVAGVCSGVNVSRTLRLEAEELHAARMAQGV